MERTGAQDRCPGAVDLHPAADGGLARIRLPGGMVTAAQLSALAAAATDFGAGTIELTGRGNVQVRGIADGAGFADAVAQAGLLPSASHERVRNIVASPLSGRVGPFADIRAQVAELDRAVQADPVLAGLPGRFWFGLDDGRGDVAGLGADLGAVRVGPGDDAQVALLAAGRDTGIRVDAGATVAALIAAARRFVDVRGRCWRVAELADPGALFGAQNLPKAESADLADSRLPTAHLPPPVGWLPQDRPAGAELIALGAAVPLGVLPARTAEFLAAPGTAVVITPWRSVLVCDLPEDVADVALRVLAPLGLVFDAASPWLRVSACTGRPGCDRALADVRADATAAVRRDEVGPRLHLVGCDRACGAPRDGQVLVATGDGYRPR